MEKLRKGDVVEWSTSRGRTSGVVRRVITRDTRVRGARLRGSEDDPVYIVKTDASDVPGQGREVALKRRP